MRLARRLVLLSVAVLAIVAVDLPAIAPGTETIPTEGSVEAVNEPGGGLYGEERHSWSPGQVTIGVNGTVAFNNPGPIPHGVEWIGGQTPPVCSSGVPVGNEPSASSPKWNGTCTFAHAGTYTYYCTVHGAAMRGTITVEGPPTPTATTGEAAEVTETSASLNGTINPKKQLTSYYFEYGPSASYGQRTGEAPVGEDESDHAVSAPVSGLAPGATYHFQLVATYASGASTTLGGDRTFRTPSPPAPPTATTGEASAIGETGATLNGVVDPESDATSYFFRYGPTASYGQSTGEQALGADNLEHAVVATLSGLAPGTTYHFQVVARSALGTVAGVDQMFTTVSPPPVSPPLVPPASPSPTPLSQPPSGVAPLTSPLAVAAGALTTTIALAGTQRGATVHGTLQVPTAFAGARLEVDLLNGSLLGRLVRSSVKPGKLSFTVTLGTRGKRALRHRRRLTVTVKITLTPPHGTASGLTRKVVLHR